MVAVIAENDLVTSMSTHTWPDPAGHRKITMLIGVFRIRDGRIVEH
jgi:predicted SnoaL-like aldol condensation-catalyzing enzyme